MSRVMTVAQMAQTGPVPAGASARHRGVVGPFATIIGAAQPAGPAADRIIAGAPVDVVTDFYASQDSKIQVGHWRCTPGRWHVAYDETEYCRIIAGVGAVIADDGVRVAIAAGDEFVIPAGFTGEWEVTETMTKTYVTVLR